MSHGHGFWFLLVCASLVWYSTITIYVSIKGSFDIRQMLSRLKRKHEDENGLPRGPKA